MQLTLLLLLLLLVLRVELSCRQMLFANGQLLNRT